MEPHLCSLIALLIVDVNARRFMVQLIWTHFYYLIEWTFQPVIAFIRYTLAPQPLSIHCRNKISLIVNYAC